MRLFKPNIQKMQDKKDVIGLANALADEDPKVRNGAAIALGKIGDVRAIEALIVALRDTYRDIRLHAAEALGEIKDTRAIEPLIVALDDGVGTPIAEALKKIGMPAIVSLIAALQDKNEDIRRRAAMTLGWIKNSRAVEPLIVSLSDPSNSVCNCAIGALKNIGTPAIDPLIALLHDKRKDVRSHAVTALGGIGYPAVDPLISALHDANEDVWNSASMALQKIRAQAIKPLITALKGAEKETAARAATILGWIAFYSMPIGKGTQQGGAAEVYTFVSRNVLGKIGDQIAANSRDADVSITDITTIIEALVTTLKHSDKDVRESATYALGRIHDLRVVDPLISMLNDPDAGVRTGAVWALGVLKATRAIDVITAALSDIDEDVRIQAETTLLKSFGLSIVTHDKSIKKTKKKSAKRS